MAMSYDYELQAQIFDYMTELERNINGDSRGEALDVLKWYLESENFADMGRRQDGVYLNLIGSH